jgi:hypothetical protein
MADSILPRRRNLDHRFFVVFAAAVVTAVLVGFGPTFYLKPFFNSPPVARTIIYVHGFVMAAWVLLFVTQVFLISSKRIKLHQKLGFAGLGLAILVFVTGILVTIGAAKYGTAASPPGIPPLEFMIRRHDRLCGAHGFCYLLPQERSESQTADAADRDRFSSPGDRQISGRYDRELWAALVFRHCDADNCRIDSRRRLV